MPQQKPQHSWKIFEKKANLSRKCDIGDKIDTEMNGIKEGPKNGPARICSMDFSQMCKTNSMGIK